MGVSFLPQCGAESEDCPTFPRNPPISRRRDALESFPRLGLEECVCPTKLSASFVCCMTLELELVVGFGSALRRAVSSELVVESSGRVSYSSGVVALFLSDVSPSACLASR